MVYPSSFKQTPVNGSLLQTNMHLKIFIALVFVTLAAAAPAEVAPRNELDSRSFIDTVKHFFETLFGPSPPDFPPPIAPIR